MLNGKEVEKKYFKRGGGIMVLFGKEVSILEKSKYSLESMVGEYLDLDDETMEQKINDIIPNNRDSFKMYLIIKRTKNLLSIIDKLIDNVYDGCEVRIKSRAQQEMCDKFHAPLFAPEDGICYYCNEQIYEHIPLDIATNEHITSCPICSHTYCD